MSVLSQKLNISIKTNDNGTVLLETRKCRQAITDAQRKVVWDYYFDLANRKLVHKHIQKWFLQEFWHLLLQFTISKMFSPNFAHLDSGTSCPSLKK